MSEEHSFWAERAVDKITEQKRREYVCEGQWTPSGYFHIGNARPEIFTPYSVYLVLKERGFKAKQNLIIDDFDPGIPVKKGNEDKFIGVPCRLAPSPFKGHKSWADYFFGKVTDSIEQFGLELNFISAFESYKKGRFNDLIVFSLDHSKEIVSVWNRIAGTDKPETFLPVVVTCEKCGKSLFSKTLSWDGKKVQYECKCGFTGETSPLNGKAKLHWRVHWVANWIVNNVAFESGGKDHFSKGGSVDVARALIQEVFKKQAPYQVPTEFVQLKGAKMSGSVGNLFGLSEWLQVASPELFRFLFFSYKPNSAIDFSLSDNSFILLNERFERAEKIFYGKEKAENERIEERLKNAYALSVIGKPEKKMPLQIPYSFAAQFVQFFDPKKQFGKIIELLKQTGHLKTGKISAPERKRLQQQLNRAKNWIEGFAPKGFKLSFLEELSEKQTTAMDQSARKLLPVVAEKTKEKKSAADIQQAIFETAKSNNLKPKQLFRAIYLALLGEESGPRAGLLILALGKEKCSARLREAAN
jgi:lysyl-tRNA synthetase class 1